MSRSGKILFLTVSGLKGGAEKYFENLYSDFCAAYPDLRVEYRHIQMKGRFSVLPLFQVLLLGEAQVVYNMSVLGIYALPLALLKLMGRRVILFPHIVTDHRTLRSKLPALRNLMRTLCLRLADAVVLISDGNRETLEGFPKSSKFSFVYNYVNCENDRPVRVRANRDLAIIGRLQDRQKRQRQFLEKFGTRCRDLGITVHLFGDGEEREAIESVIRRQGLEATVVLHGWLSEEEIFSHPFGFVLCYSGWEGLPLNLLESIYRDRVVLGIDIPGVRELLHPPFLFRTDEELDGLLETVVRNGAIDGGSLDRQKAGVYAKYGKRRTLADLHKLLRHADGAA